MKRVSCWPVRALSRCPAGRTTPMTTQHPKSSTSRWRSRRRLLGRAFVFGVVVVATATTVGTAAAAPKHKSVDLGPNVTIFDPSMPVSEIQAILDATHAAQVDDERGTNRFAYFFKPGTYGTAENPLQIKV